MAEFSDNKELQVEMIQSWGDTYFETNVGVENLESKDKVWEESPFPIDNTLNSKIALWNCTLEYIQCDAIVCTNIESLNSKSDQTLRILSSAGPNMIKELRRQGDELKTTEVRITDGYQLPCKYVLHCVGPKYTEKFETAAESALFSCYHRLLIEAHIIQVKSVAFPCVHTAERGYPTDSGAHIAIRTIRCYMNKYPNAFDKIILCLLPSEENIYMKCMELYFPRSTEELELACRMLPKDIGNQKGEPVHEGREIRVIKNPLARNESKEDTLIVTKEDLDDYVREINSIESIDETEMTAHRTTKKKDMQFVKMQRDLDEDRKHSATIEKIILDKEECKRRYLIYLRNAKTENVSEVAQFDPIFKLGVDISGRLVLGYASRTIPASKLNVEKVKLYFVKYMDSLVNHPYILVYFHTLSQDENLYTQEFIEEIYQLSSDKYKNNLHALYVVHPNFWFKLKIFKFLYWVGYDIKDRVWMINSLQELCKHLENDNFEFPRFILDYDQSKNGTLRKKSRQERFDNGAL